MQLVRQPVCFLSTVRGNTFRLSAGRPVCPPDSFSCSVVIRDMFEAARFACARQLSVQPFLAALTVLFTLGTIPTVMTLSYSIMRELSDWYRNALHARRNQPPAHVTEVRHDRNQSFLLHDPSVRNTAIAVENKSMAAKSFIQRLEPVELS
jgi:hypothetical protein